MKAWRTVFLKEVRENLRDRRSLLSSLVFGAMFGPLLFALILGFVISREADKGEKPLKLPVAGAENAPTLVAWLNRQGVIVEPVPDDAERAIAERRIDLVLNIPPKYPNQWRAGESAVIEIWHDSSRRDTDGSVKRAESLVSAWGAQTAAQRLLLRGIDPTSIRPVEVQLRDQSTPESRGALILAMLPYLVMLSVFIGGMYLAIDITAGERERRSLEPLLLNPAAVWQIVLGKMLATLLFALISLALTLVMFRLGMQFLPIAKIGVRFNLTALTLATMFVLMVPVALLAVGLQTLTAAFSRSFREAQTYLSFLMFVPLLPSLWLAVSPVKPEMWMMALPLFNQSLLIQMLSRAEVITPSWHGAAALATSITGLLTSGLAINFYRRPEMLNG